MSQELYTHSSRYDLQRLVVLMILAGAFISAAGISISIWAKYLVIGTEVFVRRADFLGDYIHSPLAYIYNLSLVIAGSCILLSMYGLFKLRLGNYSHYVAVAGFWVGLSIILIGVFPINYLDEHRLVSTSFLLGTFVLHLLTISMRINHKDICPNILFILSFAGFISASGLIYQLDWKTLDFTACNHDQGSICWVALNMWFQTSITMIWCIVLAITVRNLANNTNLLMTK